MLSLEKPVAQLPFLGAGVALFGVKIGVDLWVSRAFARPYSVLFYVSPMDSPLLHPKGELGYWLTMWGVALPFILVGLWLTLRRLRDAGAPSWLAALFFVPFANLLFFVACAAVPSRKEARFIVMPPKRSPTAAVLLASTAGAVIGLGALGVSVGILRDYGAALMVGAPAITGFSSALIMSRLRGPSLALSLVSTLLAMGVSLVVCVAFAVEGGACLLMAAPLLVVMAGMGMLLGHAVARSTYSGSGAGGASPTPVMAVLPLLLFAEQVNPLPEPVAGPVESIVEVDAPPDVVWQRVIAFPDLPPPTEAIFRAGVAAPLRATIDGAGPGAVRRCVFTTGTFVEPIEVWNPGHELTFRVADQPDPMKELTLYEGPRPAHLDGYLRSTRGQFVLEALPGGRTRLIGRTWYTVKMTPEPYWRALSDRMIHAIHLRVLTHIARLSEADAHAP